MTAAADTQRRIAIIGAGPAGSVAAIMLARRGWDVHLYESRVFPRIKVCGEFISPAATPILESVLASSSPPRATGSSCFEDEPVPTPSTSPSNFPNLNSLRALPVHHFQLNIGEGSRDRTHTWPLPRPAFALSRASLDSQLLAIARDNGATIHQPAPVRGITYTDSAATIDAADGPLSAALVIHADGSGRHDPAGPMPRSARLIGHKCHLRLPAGLIEGVWIRAARNGYVGLIEVENGLATCAFVATAAATRTCRGDIDALLRSLWPTYDPAWRTSEFHSCPVPRSRYITPGHPRSLRIGNAAAAVDPVGGEGIGLAIWSAHTAATLIGAAPGLGDTSAIDTANTAVKFAAAERSLAAAYRRRLRTRLPACAIAAETLMHPPLIAALWPLLGSRLARDPWLWLTGKRDAAEPVAALGPYA